MSSSSDLPKDFDVVVIGTGLTESIASAALSRIGKTVLQIDRNAFYGGEFSSHSLSNLIEFAENLKKKKHSTEQTSDSSDTPATATATAPANNSANSCETADVSVAPPEIRKETRKIACNRDLSNYFVDFEYKWPFDEMIAEAAATEGVSANDHNGGEAPAVESVKEKLLKLNRKFNLDLSPNLFFSRGSFVELLISSEVSKYCEFRLVSQILTRRADGSIDKVPTSRYEVFKSTQLSIFEKRAMMQFVQACVKDNNFAELIGDSTASAAMSFSDFIAARKMPASIAHYLVNAVAMCPHPTDTALQGLNAVKKFLNSVGRFGDSPYLYSLYGSGEISQCFCRMAAVFGAVFYLNLTVDNLHANPVTNIIESVSARNESDIFTFNCQHVIMDSSYAPATTAPIERIARCILITDRSIFDAVTDAQDAKRAEEAASNDNLSILYLPRDGTASDIYMLELSYASQCCPTGYYLVHLFCKQSNTANAKAEEEFLDTIHQLFDASLMHAHDHLSSPVDAAGDEHIEKASTASLPGEEEKQKKQEKQEKQKPKVLFSCFYSHLDSDDLVRHHRAAADANADSAGRGEHWMPKNVHLVAGSSVRLDFDSHVLEAERIFRTICPIEPFLPRPPAQEDIIFDDKEKEEKQQQALSAESSEHSPTVAAETSIVSAIDSKTVQGENEATMP